MAPFKVLSTKKLDPDLVAWAKEKGIDVVENEFIAIHPVTSIEKREEIVGWVSKESETTIVFTSQHAVECVSQLLGKIKPNWNVFCLEGATKTKVVSNHLRIIATATNAKALATAIVNSGVTEIVFFCGNKRRDDLPSLLSASNVLVHEVTVYETTETPSVTEAVDGILFFSPSAVHSFFAMNQLTANTVCFAIGETTAAAIREYATNNIITSERPGQETMMAHAELYFRNIKCKE